MSRDRPRVVIVGGGFGGLAAARSLADAAVDVVLIDRTNHHLFQPLLYQVATAVLSPAQIAAPLRGLLETQRNATVILGEVTAVDKAARTVHLQRPDAGNIEVSYEHLILATGVRHSYFGHEEFEPHAPGLKDLADAVSIRHKILRAFEVAEAAGDPAACPEWLTFVLVGGGPTGVEMAGAIAVMAVTSLRRQYRRCDPRAVRIVLLDASPRVLANFPEELSAAAAKRLAKLGVEVRTGTRVELIDAEGVIANGERIPARTVIWTAGVAPSPAGHWLEAETDRAGRVRVAADLTLPGHPEIQVIGDTACFEQDGKPLPGVAQVAMQQGAYAGRRIARVVAGEGPPKPFRYFDKGSMAVVGKGYAVVHSHDFQFKGFGAWLAWVFVHLQFLARFSLRLSVFVQWAWTFITDQRGSQLIVNHRANSSGSSD